MSAPIEAIIKAAEKITNNKTNVCYNDLPTPVMLILDSLVCWGLNNIDLEAMKDDTIKNAFSFQYVEKDDKE